MYTPSDRDIKTFTLAYLESLIWSSDPQDGSWSDANASPDMRRRAEAECLAFLYRVGVYIDTEPTKPGMEQAGHDFALTRNRHGAGFWDGDWPVYGDLLTGVSHSFGEVDVYIGDDGLLYS